MIPQCDILIGDVRAMLKTLPDESMQCVVTSPPYWGLRDYGTEPQIWDGNPRCDHEWGEAGRKGGGGHHHGEGSAQNGTKQMEQHESIAKASTGAFCHHCGAWRGELGLEPTPDLFVEHIVEVFREVKRVLRKDGTCWVNMGDCYASGASSGNRGDRRPEVNGRGESQVTSKGRGDRSGSMGKAGYREDMIGPNRFNVPGLKPKDLVGQPWRVAFGLQNDGWWLRSDIIWHKPNPMPESIYDRPTKAHEYIFLLTKSAQYYYDDEAIKEAATGGAHARGKGNNRKVVPAGWAIGPGSHTAIDHNQGPKDDGRKEQGLRDSTKFGRGKEWRVKQNESFSTAITHVVETRNARSVWTIPTEPYPEAHYATFPTAIPRRCILAGSKQGDTVLDPFGGSGTVGQVALEYGRNAILIDLNPKNELLMRGRMAQHTGQGVLAAEEDIEL